jgi:hypothetical protein
MEAYYSDGRGRYNTGESYDWFYEYEDGNKKILTSSDHLWTYTYIDGGIEVLRYNGNEVNLNVPSAIDGNTVISLDSFRIKGITGSTAEKYAKENEIEFIPLRGTLEYL